ncbi:MAG: SDR family NAD(P)-dependent oxidoreductase [Acetobacteraceae bacterium]
MNPAYDFTGRVALVTGAASGIGLSTARAFAGAAAAVVLADPNSSAGEAAADTLGRADRKALAVACGVSDEEQVAAMMRRAVGTFGRLDMAFSNAGIQVPPNGAADEIAAAVLRLCSPGARFGRRLALPADGAFIARRSTTQGDRSWPTQPKNT